MIGTGWNYKGLDLSNSLIKSNEIYVQDIKYNAGVRISATQNSNDNGARLSRALSNGRRFNFDVSVLEVDENKRGLAVQHLIDTVMIEYDPTKNQFYDLNWNDQLGNERTCLAAVFSEPDINNSINNPRVDASFSLYSPSPRVYNPNIKKVSGGIGDLGGIPYPFGSSPSPEPQNTHPDPRGGYAGGIVCYNSGNRTAPLRIEIKGEVTDPVIINRSDKRYIYKLSGTYKNLVYDNTDNVFVDSNGKIIQVITEQGADATANRLSGKEILLNPGQNIIVVSGQGEATVDITFRDTYKLP